MIHRRWWDDLSARAVLRAEILHRAEYVPNYTATRNQGGWRSREDVLDWALPDVQHLREHLRRSVADVHVATATFQRHRAFSFRAWAIVNRTGSCHLRHAHGESMWSGVCYLDGETDSACTVFEVSPEVRIAPEPGLVVIFPSMTWHSVEPHRGAEPRVTIAFDAR